MYQVDLNCDLGESFGNYRIGQDEKLMQYISSANIACGFHGGDPGVMEATVAAALKHKVAIGAHPGFPDLQGFGRRNMDLTAKEVYQIVIYQLGALAAFTKIAGSSIQHVKPHGALYTTAAIDIKLAEAIAAAVSDFDSSLILYGLAGSALVLAGKSKGLRTAEEVFADRTYTTNGTLTPRSSAAAHITDPHEAARQAVKMVKEGTVFTNNRTTIKVKADTICIHGDKAEAFVFASTIAEALRTAGITIKAPGAV